MQQVFLVALTVFGAANALFVDRESGPIRGRVVDEHRHFGPAEYKQKLIPLPTLKPLPTYQPVNPPQVQQLKPDPKSGFVRHAYGLSPIAKKILASVLQVHRNFRVLAQISATTAELGKEQKRYTLKVVVGRCKNNSFKDCPRKDLHDFRVYDISVEHLGLIQTDYNALRITRVDVSPPITVKVPFVRINKSPVSY